MAASEAASALLTALTLLRLRVSDNGLLEAAVMKDAAEVWECRGDCVREEDAQSARQIHISIFSVTGAAALVIKGRNQPLPEHRK